MASPVSTDRDPLELLAAEFMERLRQGQRPSAEDYAEQHPELAGEIRELFPTIAMTERCKARAEQTSGGRATLGAAQLSRLGDFRIIREIGRGGMGVVFEAEQESLGRRVAVKVLPRQALLDEKHLKRFQREARIAANLHHTNIVEVFGVGEQDGFHYYVMQCIEGVGLDAVVPALANIIDVAARNETASVVAAAANRTLVGTVRELLGEAGFEQQALLSAYWQNVARIGWQAADALSHAHSQGVLHRDIKPANLLLTPQGAVWLTDFGLAKAAQADDLSLSQGIVGTLRYMAPEQFAGRSDHRSDLYSLGLTLYELLALRPAYEESDQSKLMQRIVAGGPTPPGAVRPGIPVDLETVILKAVSHEADRRYQSAAALADDLRCFLEDRPVRARRVSAVEQLSRWCRRNQALASLAGTILLLLAVVAAVASIGYVRTKAALRGEARERAKAEANASLAVEALDRTFERLYPTRMRVQAPPAPEGLRGEIVDVPTVPFLSKTTAALLEDMLPFYDRLAQQTGNGEDLQLRTAEANRHVAAIEHQLGQTPAAVRADQRAIALFQALRAHRPADGNYILQEAQTENELGRLFTSLRQMAEARQSHQAALALLQTTGVSPTAPFLLRFELARTYYFLGLRDQPLPALGPRTRGAPEPISRERQAALATAVDLLTALSAAQPDNPECQHLLALCYLEGAKVANAPDSPAQSGDERAIAILQGLVAAYPAQPDYASDLSAAYAQIHIPAPPIPADLANRVAQRYRQSLALLEQLVADHPDVPEFRAAEARILHKLGAFYGQREEWNVAEPLFRQAIAIHAPLVQQFPDVAYYGLWLANFHLALADALSRLGRPDEAVVEADGTIATLLAEAKQRPELNILRELIPLAYSQRAIALRQAGKTEPAVDAAPRAQPEEQLRR